MQEEIGRGAEAYVLKTDKGIEKIRPIKSYRHPALDAQLRKQRTRKEAKILLKLHELYVPAPKLISVDESAGLIVMSELMGSKLRDVVDGNEQLCIKVGGLIAILHDNNIIHGDLTTSNMITSNDSVALIDFGLSFHSTKAEDKAVDIHVFKQALESKHHLVAKKAWALFLKGYNPREREVYLKRFELVEKRGRNKG